MSFRVAAFIDDSRDAISLTAHAGRSGPGGDDGAAVTRDCLFDGVVHATPVLQRAALAAGVVAEGPVLIDEDGAATVVPPGFQFEVHTSGALFITGAARAGASS